MRHSFFDKYSDLDTPIHRLNTRLKLFIFLGLLIAIALLRINLVILIVGVALFTALFYIAKIPARFILKRLLVIMPFLIFIIIFIPLFQDHNWTMAAETFAKALLSVMSLILFIATTRFPMLLQELEKIGVPKMIVQILAFIYRYFFVLIGELERMELAVKARTPEKRRRFLFRGFSHILGMLIIRSYERSERIYQAMQLRGHQDGNE